MLRTMIWLSVINFLALSSFFVQTCAQLDCTPISYCESCAADEMDEGYCQLGGRKRLHFCTDNDSNTKKEIYLSCERTGGEEFFSVLVFLLIVLALGGYGYYFIQNRKKLTMTAFDARKLQPQ